MKRVLTPKFPAKTTLLVGLALACLLVAATAGGRLDLPFAGLRLGYQPGALAADGGISLGKDSTAVGNVPPNTTLGHRSTLVLPSNPGSTNTIYTQGGTAIGTCAYGPSGSVVIGAGAMSGANPNPSPNCR